MASGPLCVRLPPDLHAAVDSAATEAGVSTAEWIRDILFRVVYSAPPGVEEGYMQGRRVGLQIARLAIHEAWNQMPDNIEDAMAKLQGR